MTVCTLKLKQIPQTLISAEQRPAKTDLTLFKCEYSSAG